MESINIEKEYQELIQYISCLGNVELYKDFMSLTIRVFDTSLKEVIKVEISIPKINGEYDKSQVTVRWKNPSHTDHFQILKFNTSMEQKMMFNVLLFAITNGKLNYLADRLCIARNVEKK